MIDPVSPAIVPKLTMVAAPSNSMATRPVSTPLNTVPVLPIVSVADWWKDEYPA